MIEKLQRLLDDHAVNPDDECCMSELQLDIMSRAALIVRVLCFARHYQYLTATGATWTAKIAAQDVLFTALDELERGE